MTDTDNATDADDSTDLMDTLDELAGDGRVPVEELCHEDPRLTVRTPAGDIRVARTPDWIKNEGSAKLRAWNIGEYRLEEDRDGQPGISVPHAVTVRKRD